MARVARGFDLQPTAERSPVLLGDLDYAIFTELQRDGRIPFTTLAERLGVSETHVRRRVKSLTDADAFSIVAVADPRVLGLDYMAWVALVVRHPATAAVAEALAELPEVDYVVITSGEFNVMAEVACRSSANLYHLLLRLRAIPGVQRTETFVYLDLVRQQFQWALDDGRGGAHVGAADGVHGDASELESIDIEIIGELQRDGRAPFRQLAERLGASERVVSTRFAQLVEKNALQVIAVGNPLTLGFGAMAWLGIRLGEGANNQAVAVALARVRGLDYVVVPAGRYDVMAELVCRNREDLLTTLERDVGAIEGIANVETFFYLRLLYKSAAGAWGAARSLTVAQPGDVTSPGRAPRARSGPDGRPRPARKRK
jgi:DNA-binding Lrp family transcriptional regulator